MNVRAYQKRNLLWIAALITAYTMMASVYLKVQTSVFLKEHTAYQGSTR